MNDEARTLEEAYTSATHSSDLRVEADRRGDADILIAAGWSQSRIGGALLRLHSEYDGAAKLPLVTARACMPAYEMQHEIEHAGRKPSTDELRDMHSKAAEAAHRINLLQAGHLLERLKSLPDARVQAVIQLVRWGISDADNKAAAVLRWWLAQTCHACGGTKWETVPGTNRHGQKHCRVCHGSGLSPVPCGEEGKRLANWLDDCASRGRSRIRSRLHESRQK